MPPVSECNSRTGVAQTAGTTPMLALYEETPEIKDGHLVLPQKPGLGLKFDEKAIKSFRA